MIPPEVQILRMWAAMAIRRVNTAQRDERGEIAQTVIIVAVLAAAALAITAIIVKKFTDKANTIPTQ